MSSHVLASFDPVLLIFNLDSVHVVFGGIRIFFYTEMGIIRIVMYSPFLIVGRSPSSV